MLLIKVDVMFAMWFLKVICMVAADVTGVTFKRSIRFVAMGFFFVVVQKV